MAVSIYFFNMHFVLLNLQVVEKLYTRLSGFPNTTTSQSKQLVFQPHCNHPDVRK